MWRVGHAADYGAFQDAARSRIDLAWRTRSARSAWSSTPWFREADVARLSPFVRHHVCSAGPASSSPTCPGSAPAARAWGGASFGSRAGPRSLGS